MNTLVISETVHESPSGRRYIQFQPVLRTDCLASGSLKFALWQSWEDEPNTHESARLAALSNAKEVLGIIAREVTVKAENTPELTYPSYGKTEPQPAVNS